MPRKRGTLRTKWLGRTLKELRDSNELTLSEAAEYLERDPSVLSRMENGALPIQQRDVEALLDLYNVNEAVRREAIIRFAQEAWRTDWWDGYAGQVADTIIDLAWIESLAQDIRTFSTTSIDGLLQTADYARTVVTAVSPEAPVEQIDRWVRLRLMRQAALERVEPPRVSMVLDEAVLHRQVGGPAVMAEQLRHLLAQAARPHIVMRVLTNEAGAHASPEGMFRLFTLPEPLSEVVCVDSPAGTLYLEPPRTADFVHKYNRLESAALGPEDSQDLIRAAAEELERS